MTMTHHLLANDVAAALLNARGARRGAPRVANILALVPQDIRDAATDDALAAIEAVVRASVVACIDRLPPVGSTVLAYDADRDRWRYIEYSDGGRAHWRDEHDDRLYANITHWYLPSLSLPTPKGAP